MAKAGSSRAFQGAEVGQLASEGWRATKDQTGLFEFPSLEGDPLIRANARPSMSSWTVGVAVKKAELQQAAWATVRWAVLLGAGLSAASLLLAWFLARQITRPIDQLRQAFADVSAEPGKPIEIGTARDLAAAGHAPPLDGRAHKREPGAHGGPLQA